MNKASLKDQKENPLDSKEKNENPVKHLEKIKKKKKFFNIRQYRL